MRRLATFATLVALSAFGLSGSALAQDDSGGASEGAAAASSDSSAPAEASDATADPTDATVADDADCPAGSAKGSCAAPTSADPFASVSWQDPAPTSLATPGAGAGSIYGTEPPSIGGAR